MRAPRSILLALASLVLARAPSRARADGERTADRAPDRVIEAWVGTWRGDATWKGCTAPGPEALTLALTWQDGGAALDGAAVFDPLGALWLERGDGGALRVVQDDVTIELAPARPRKGKAARRATLSLRTTSQCTMTARLTRDTTGIAACDDLVALAAAAPGCDGVTVADAVLADADTWPTLTGKARKAAARACAAAADTVRGDLAAADCLPLAPGEDPSQIAACAPAWQLAARVSRCTRLPVETQQAAIAGTAQLRRSLRASAGKASANELAAEMCKAVAEDLQLLLDLRGCP